VSQSFLCTILVVYDLISSRKPRTSSAEPEDPWGSVLDDARNWLKNTKLTPIASVLAFNYGTYLAAGQSTRSTFFCSSLLDSRNTTAFLQLVGLALDGVITILGWRILTWAKTTKARLRTLSLILLLSSLIISFLWMGPRLYRSRSSGSSSFSVVQSLYIFDVLIDSFALSCFIISTGLLICETTPVTPVSIITFLCGILACIQNVLRIGTWQQESRSAALGPAYLISFGFIIFLYASNIRAVIFIRRAFLAILLALVLIGVTVFALVKRTTVDRHPLDKLIYDTRIEADRWLRHATVSNSIKVAVEEYQERHHGRNPPANFDQWYTFARLRDSPILDRFEQIENDILPFWGMKAAMIREKVTMVSNEPFISTVSIESGQVSHTGSQNEEHQKVLDNLAQMIAAFAKHLPDMKVPINFGDRPRVLAPWEEVHRMSESGMANTFGLLTRRSEVGIAELPTPLRGAATAEAPSKPPVFNWTFTSPRVFRQMEALACPAGSPGRSGMHWNTRDFCTACASPHSDGQFLTKWEAALDQCLQPDLTRLHGFHMTPPGATLFEELVPVFSKFRTNSFSDILIPLPHPADKEPDSIRDFYTRDDSLYWRGRLGERSGGYQVFRGSHQHRLIHLVNNSTASDEITMLLPTPGNRDKFEYEVVHATGANAILPIDVGLFDYSKCVGRDCDVAMREFGIKAPSVSLDHRYVLLMDLDSGPPPTTLHTIRSLSVPFIASIFREWYTERLIPWVHFVPIDLRFHGLHSTLAYFTGLKNGKLNGRDMELEGKTEDARWIASQGKAWAEKALRKEDMEVYLFRLLLEWGRVIDDRRDEIGFRLE
jgi:hypothetical protein